MTEKKGLITITNNYVVFFVHMKRALVRSSVRQSRKKNVNSLPEILVKRILIEGCLITLFLFLIMKLYARVENSQR